MSLPLFVVCEDGHEYTERFERFLHRQFRFVRAADWRSVQAALRAELPAALLVDLDFRRTPAADLLGEQGPPGRAPSPEEKSRWAARQGILLLQYLRNQGVLVPALLFADLDDNEQATYLEHTLAPLAIVESREGLAQLAARLRRLAGAA